MTKLIIIRGPSGAGKTSVAKILKEQAKRPTMLIEQDLFRTLSNEKVPNQLPVQPMVEAVTKIALEHGFDVIVEGILNVIKPGKREMYDRLFKYHPEENYIFYMDVSFEETVKRHETRPEKRVQFDGEAMRPWYSLASPMKHADEIIIPESSSLEETVRLIQKTAGI